MKVIAFDVFGTVVDLSGAQRADLVAYSQAIRRPVWAPLSLPSSWEKLPAHHDSAEGIRRLRSKFFVCTCSNGPLGMMAKLSKFNGIEWDAIIPLELNEVYKPDPRAYLTVCEVLGVEPSDVTMVTANEKFGDLEAAAELGMTPEWIRGDSRIPTIIDLAERLGC